MKIEKLTCGTFSLCPRYRTLNARRLSCFEKNTLPLHYITLYYTKRFNLHYYIMIIRGYIADYSKGAKPRRYCNLRNLSHRISPVNARINISGRGAEFSRCNSLNKARKVNWNTRVNKRVSSCWTPDHLEMEESGSRRSRDYSRYRIKCSLM